jgi:hypothetical protein
VLWQSFWSPDAEIAEADQQRAVTGLARMVAHRKPELVPHELKDLLLLHDDAPLAEALRGYSFGADWGSDDGGTIWDHEARSLSLRGDVLLGGYRPFLSLGMVFLAWHALWTRRWAGRSPGKAPLGIRVVRLDGKPLGLLDCFERAGSYAATAGTMGMGFLTVLWDENRRALHDRAAGTVVLRAGGSAETALDAKIQD